MGLCSCEQCTGCGACAYVCPKKCISLVQNEMGIVYPKIDTSECIQCGRCERICPQNKIVSEHMPYKAYAAWSSNSEERRTSASGGVAHEVYCQALSEGKCVVGASTNADFSVSLKLASTDFEIRAFKNSKYVFSTAYDLFPQMERRLKSGEDIVFIGLPCQVAAVKNIFSKYNEKILYIDVVCHGTTPDIYLKEHIRKIEEKTHRKAAYVDYRDPELETHKHVFSLYDENRNRFYAKRTKDGDTYQYGYHRMISYRENCYHCIYAKPQRVSDLTLSDYKGLGTLAPCPFDAINVSSVLINTQKGEEFFNTLMNEGRIKAYERPVQEPLQGDEQLKHPAKKSRHRIAFERNMQREPHLFEDSINNLAKKNMIREKMLIIRQAIRRIKKKI